MIRIQTRISTRTSCPLFSGAQTELLHVKIEKIVPLWALSLPSALLHLAAHQAAAGVLMQHCCLPHPLGGGGGEGVVVRTQRSRSCPPEMMTSLLFHIRPPLGAPNEQLWCCGAGGGDWQTHQHPPWWWWGVLMRGGHCHSGRRLLIDPHSKRYRAAAVGRLQQRQDQHQNHGTGTAPPGTRTEAISSEDPPPPPTMTSPPKRTSRQTSEPQHHLVFSPFPTFFFLLIPS